jgi:cystathionine gamma-lyase
MIIITNLLIRYIGVERVIYPGLPSHPQHELAKVQMSGFGGMITFFLKGMYRSLYASYAILSYDATTLMMDYLQLQIGGLKESRVWLENLHLFHCAESLGAVESLAEHPAIMTHASVPAEQRAKLGISDNMVRLSVGVEDLEDIMAGNVMIYDTTDVTMTIFR